MSLPSFVKKKLVERQNQSDNPWRGPSAVLKSDKPLLSGELKKRLVDRMSSVSNAARQLGIAPSSVRGWLYRDHYPEIELLELLRASGLPTELSKLRELFQFKTTTPRKLPKSRPRDIRPVDDLTEALALVDQRVEQFSRLYQQFNAEVGLLFDSMRNDDVFIYLSLTEHPIETGETGFQHAGPKIAQAIDHEAWLVYLFPTDRVGDSHRKLRLDHIPTAADFQQRYDDFRERLSDLLPKSATKLEQRLLVYPCDLDAFMVPRHKYVLFKPSSAGARALARYPTGNASREIAIFQPLDQSTTEQLARYLTMALDSAKAPQRLIRLLRSTHTLL